MEITLHSKSFENIKDKNNLNINKPKILYKFNIMNSIPIQNNYMGRCYLVKFHSLTNKDLSSPKTIKNPEKLPLIRIKEDRPRLKTIAFTNSRKIFNDIKDKNKFTDNNNESKTTIPSHYSNKTLILRLLNLDL